MGEGTSGDIGAGAGTDGSRGPWREPGFSAFVELVVGGAGGGPGTAGGVPRTTAGDDGFAIGRDEPPPDMVMKAVVVKGGPPITVAVVVSVGTEDILVGDFLPGPAPRILCASWGSLQPMETPAMFDIGRAKHFWFSGHASSWNTPALQRAIWPLMQATCVPEQADWGFSPEFRLLRLSAWARFVSYTFGGTEAVPTG